MLVNTVISTMTHISYRYYRTKLFSKNTVIDSSQAFTF